MTNVYYSMHITALE